MYFGRDLRDFLDEIVYEAFKDAGHLLETLYRAAVSDQSTLVAADVIEAEARVATLNNLAYQLSFTMMVRLREGKVGRRAPGLLDEPGLRLGQ